MTNEFSNIKEPDEEELEKILNGEKINNEIKIENDTLLVNEVKVDMELFNEDDIGDLEVDDE